MAVSPPAAARGRAIMGLVTFGPIAVAAAGTLAALRQGGRVVVVDLTNLAILLELPVEAAEVDLVWVGSPPRLVVLTQHGATCRALLIDPGAGAAPIAQLGFEVPMRLVAATETHALALGSLGPTVITVGDAHLAAQPLSTAARPGVGGVAASQLLLALPSAIEEWDPRTRTPRRRLRLPRSASITALGGSPRVVWFVTAEEPRRVDVVPLVNRGQPRAHELPEPIAAVSGHPRSDLLVVLGAQTRRVYAIDLDGRRPMRVVPVGELDRPDVVALVVGTATGVAVAQAGGPLVLQALPDRERDIASAEPAAGVVARVTSAARSPERERASIAPPGEATAPGGSIAERLARRRVQLAQRIAPAADTAVDDAAAAGAPATWRDALVEQVGRVLGVRAGAATELALDTPPIDALAARFEVPALLPALRLLYGAHLRGHGVARYALARVLGDRPRWDGVLDGGELVTRGLAVLDGAELRLAAPILRALDELPPATGILVGEPGTITLVGACAVVAEEPHEPLAAIAARLAPQVGGAILAAFEGVERRTLVLEARARGAAPMLRIHGALAELPVEPVVLVVAEAAHLGELRIPRLA